MPDECSRRIVCMCGKNIGFRIAKFLLGQSAQVRFVVNEHEESGKWYRTPRELKIQEIHENEISEFDPDLIITAFYDKILPESIYGIPDLGCWNLHLGDPELYRGAYPNIQALKNGDTTYAVTLHEINAGIDTGDILAKRTFPLSSDITGRDLYDRMVEEGMQLFMECYSELISGDALKNTREQNDAGAVTHYRGELRHELDPQKEFRDSVRALTFPPFPPPYFMIGDRRFLIVEDRSENGSE